MTLARPMPPQGLVWTDEASEPYTRLVPAPEVGLWVQETIISPRGALYNEAHEHLDGADLEFLWASEAFGKQGRSVIGQTEKVMFRAGGWQKARQEQQMIEWFGRVPAYTITLAADYCANVDHVGFCMLVEHEMMHLAQDTDSSGSPKFTKAGLPALKIQGHDVEEFIGVVERYGMGPAEGAIARLVAAAGKAPSVGRASIAQGCGNCLKLVA